MLIVWRGGDCVKGMVIVWRGGEGVERVMIMWRDGDWRECCDYVEGW